MKKIILSLILLVPVLAMAQIRRTPCDSGYVRLFSRANFSVDSVPCEEFVVIGDKYYGKIATGYNLSRGIVNGQNEVLANLREQLELSNRYSETLKAANEAAEETIARFAANNRAYAELLNKSTSANDSLVNKMGNLLKDLDNQHKAEVRRAKWKSFAIGGVIGVVVGSVGVLLLKDKL